MALDRKSKIRKKTREISKEIEKGAQTRRHNRPFVQGPHVGMEIVGAHSLHGCRTKVVKVTEKPAQSNYKIPKKPRSVENKYENHKWYSSCYGTNNKNIKS